MRPKPHVQLIALHCLPLDTPSGLSLVRLEHESVSLDELSAQPYTKDNYRRGDKPYVLRPNTVTAVRTCLFGSNSAVHLDWSERHAPAVWSSIKAHTAGSTAAECCIPVKTIR
jgi:hypothetical protein